MTSTIGTDTLRQGDLDSLATVLKQQHARAVDVVVPARLIHVKDDVDGSVAIRLSNIDPVIDDDGVTEVNGIYIPTHVADEGFSSKLGIDLRYLRKCRREAPEIYKDNLKGWLLRDDRSFLLRLFRSDDEHLGVLRAVLSRRFETGLDNLDSLLAMLEGLRQAGVEDPVIDADLTDRRMVVRVTVPQIAVHAPKLLEDYRNPFDGSDVGRGWTPDRLRQVALGEGRDVSSKLVFAGFVFTNSEVGNGAWRMTPRLVVEACTNGLQITAEANMRRHFGAELEMGAIKWSEETYQANLKLITAQAKDAVNTFIDVDFVSEQVEKLERIAGEPVLDPTGVITAVSKKLGFTEANAKDILGYFIKGHQLTTGGVMQALTATAQTLPADDAWEMEKAAVQAMTLAHEANKVLASA